MVNQAIVLAALAPAALAAPAPQGGILSGLMNSLTGSLSLGRMMGEPNATQMFTGFAKAMGATRTSPGRISNYAKTVMNAGYGIVPAGPGAAPVKETLAPYTKVPGAKTVKIRYGPYKVPAMNKKNALGLSGMLSNYPHQDADRPCSGACTILGIRGGLEYVDGKNANIDTGMWLHHMVLFNIGEGRTDPTCNDRDVSLPHATVGGTPHNSERIFATGNERTPIVFPEWGQSDAGYKLKPADKLAMLIELMNENMEDKTVFITLTWDYVEGHPFKDEIKLIWLDAAQCGTSEINPPKGKKQFTLDYNWKSTLNGTIIGTGGHLHDGGLSTETLVDGKTVCSSVAKYGTKPEFIAPEGAMDMHAAPAAAAKPAAKTAAKSTTTAPKAAAVAPKAVVAAPAAAAPAAADAHSAHAMVRRSGGHGPNHISEQNVCTGVNGANALKSNELRVGQTWNLKGVYDFDKYPAQAHDGAEADEVMAIQFLYYRIPGSA